MIRFHRRIGVKLQLVYAGGTHYMFLDENASAEALPLVAYIF